MPQSGDTGSHRAPEQISACRQLWPSLEDACWHRRRLGKPEAPMTSSGTVSCLLVHPRVHCKGRHIRGGG